MVGLTWIQIVALSVTTCDSAKVLLYCEPSFLHLYGGHNNTDSTGLH